MHETENTEILLVEDNPNDLELILRVFKKHKISNMVHVARDGEEALNFLYATVPESDSSARQAPKLILLDLKLPKVNGLEVLQQVKNDPRTRAIPTVILTSSTEQVDIVESYALGANSFISKPVEFENFVEVVRQLGLYWLVTNESPILLL